MIEPIMYFGIGFLVAALLGLVVIPLVHRPRAAAVAHRLRVDLSGWDTDIGTLRDWYREG